MVAHRKINRLAKSWKFHNGSLIEFKETVLKDGNFPLLLPGISLVLLGVAALVAPALLVALVATFFMLVGVAFCIVAWKVIRFKKKVEKLSKELEAKIFIQSTRSPTYETAIIEEDEKKIIMH